MNSIYENPPPYLEAPGAQPPPTQHQPPYPTQPQQPYPTQPYPQQTYPNQYPPNYSNPTVINVVPATQTPHLVVLVDDGCPCCRVGVLDERFTCAGICCCVLFFPLGLICLLTMTQKVCINCGAHFK